MLSGDLKISNKTLLAVTVLILIGVGLRLVPHPANFAPITAIALIGGATLRGRWAWSLPLMIMLISDAVIGFHDVIFFTWGSFLAIGLLSSRYLSKNLKFENVLLSSMTAAVLFFVVTNFGVWIVSGYYTRDLSGLVLAYQNAIPFFRNTFMGDITFSLALYGAYLVVANKVGLPAIFRRRTSAQL